MKRILQLAAIYNILWGAYVVLFPMHFFSVLGMEPINHVAIWQGMGMVIGVYGIAYWLASYDPVRHWPIVAVGLLGKLLGPMGYIYSLLLKASDPAFGFTLLTNDLVWWIPFLYMAPLKKPSVAFSGVHILRPFGLWHTRRLPASVPSTALAPPCASSCMRVPAFCRNATHPKPGKES